jgi:hypothetical protein
VSLAFTLTQLGGQGLLIGDYPPYGRFTDPACFIAHPGHARKHMTDDFANGDSVKAAEIIGVHSNSTTQKDAQHHA